LDGNNESSVTSSSDGLGSVVEYPPLSDIIWVVVLDSKSILTVTHVLVISKRSS